MPPAMVAMAAAMAALFLLLSPAAAAAGSLGVNYGRFGNNLPSPQQAIALLESTYIRKVKLFDADAGVLRAMAHTGIEAIVTFPNDAIYAAGRRALPAFRWVRQNVLPFARSGTRIIAICVGNEVLIDLRSADARKTADQLVPAMQNIQAALVRYGLAKGTKVSTPHALNVLNPSSPPSNGTFRADLMRYLRPMLEFLNSTGAPFMANPYPYFAYRSNPARISLDYSVFRKNSGFRDSKTGLRYTNMLEAQVDTVYAALAAAGFPKLRVSVTETGWPSGGGPSEPAATPANAASYNGGVARRALSGKGTPLRPQFPLDAYIFALFEENQKFGPDSEHYYGLFHADMSLAYDAGVQRNAQAKPAPTSSKTWCVANAQVDASKLQAALDYACANSDCSAIQPGNACFAPNTLPSHASYAFNSYYQKNGRNPVACVFSGAATVTSYNPSYQGCSYS